MSRKPTNATEETGEQIVATGEQEGRTAKVQSPHDRYWNSINQNLRLVHVLLRERLPRDVAVLMSDALPVRRPATYVNRGLGKRSNDGAFLVDLTTGEEILVVLEHKSSPEPGTGLQVKGYVDDALDGWIEENPGKTQLPRVFPIVVHHGEDEWSVPRELFGTAPVSELLVSLRHIPVSLGSIPDSGLSADPGLRARLKVMKYSRAPDLVARLDDLLDGIAALNNSDHLRRTVMYLLEFAAYDAVYAALERVAGRDVKERIMNAVLEQVRLESEERGQERGEKRGEKRAKADTLVKFLQKRFGELPSGLRGRIQAADIDSLDIWLDKVLDAPDLQSIFGA